MNNLGDHDTSFDLDLFRETLLEMGKQVNSFGKVMNAHKSLTGKNASCGDSLVWKVQLSTDGKKIIALEWEGVGCIISKASANAVVEMVKVQPELAAVASWSEQDVLRTLGLQEISPGREKCLMLGLKTLQKGFVEGEKDE